MDLNEAIEFIKVNKEEEKAIDAYHYKYSQTRVNMLANFDPFVFNAAQDKSLNVEQLKQDIEDFIKIYSAMYKQKREISSRQLLRGTGDREARGLYNGGEYNRMLYASKQESAAKVFLQNGDAALIKIKVDGEIPFIDLSMDESEVVIAPFTKVKQTEFVSSGNGCKRYNVTISAPELEEIPQERIEELKEEVFSEFPHFVEECKYVGDDESKAVYDARYQRLYSFKSKLTELVQGLCKQKELEIDKAKQIIKGEQEKGKEEKTQNTVEVQPEVELNEEKQSSTQEKPEVEMEEEKQSSPESQKEERNTVEVYEEVKPEKEKQSSIEVEPVVEASKENKNKEMANALEVEKLNNHTKTGIQAGTKLNQFVKSEYEKLVNKEECYVSIAQKLGIYFERKIQMAGLEKDVAKIGTNIGKVQDDIEFLSNIENASEQEILSRQSDIKNMSDGINLGDEFSKDLPGIIQTYTAQGMDDIRKSLYVKIQTLIRDEKVKQLAMQKQKLEGSKVTMLGRMFGKAKLKNEQLRFIDLQIKSLREKPIEQREKYSVKDSLAEMRAFAMSNYETGEMQEIETNIYQIFGGFTREDVERMAEIKNSQRTNLPMKQEEIGLFEARKNAKELKQQNNAIEEDLKQNMIKVNSQRNMQYIEAKPDAIMSFKNKLQSIESVIKDRAEIQMVKQDFAKNEFDTSRLY